MNSKYLILIILYLKQFKNLQSLYQIHRRQVIFCEINNKSNRQYSTV
jgi:hypothetical protein